MGNCPQWGVVLEPVLLYVIMNNQFISFEFVLLIKRKKNELVPEGRGSVKCLAYGWRNAAMLCQP